LVRAQARARETALRASLALDNLRAFVILLVLSFHSSLAYLSFLPSAPFAFDAPPFEWRSFPIVDPERSFGLDLYCAWQDVFLMSLFFFVSGLFVWPSLRRKGPLPFLRDRVLRLGLPFAVVVLLLIPVAHFPTYLQTAAAPSLAAYWRHWLALPFWPAGPMWFLWLLLVADIATAGLYQLASRASRVWTRLASAAAERLARFIAAFLTVSMLVYVPLALAFTPWAWAQWGPFSFQLARPLHYALYFFAGVGLGAGGIERGLFAPQATLARRWPAWLALALASFLLWMALTGLTMTATPPLLLRVLAYASYPLASFGSCFCVLALFLRFGRKSARPSESLRRNAYGMYLVHYPFVVWLQYALLPLALPAILKAAAVFAAALATSWTATAVIRLLPPAAAILAPVRQTAPRPS
jgi:peptidoglycan/LPS O-acetylase OafA/YrhL